MNKVTIFILFVSTITAQTIGSSYAVQNNSIPIFVSSEVCLDYRLHCPWDESTALFFNTPVDANITISVYSMNGELISNLVNEFLPSGPNTVNWDGKDRRGNIVEHDVYSHICKVDPL
jgi:flagellar hook assembly protein FlgD